MIMTSVLKGCAIGFSIAMPVGPIGLLCIKNSLTRGMTFGLAAGFGAACADTVFGLVGGYGVAIVSELISSYHHYIEAAGAIFLLYLGISTFFEKVDDNPEIEARGGLTKVFTSTFFLTMTNPLTILSFAGIFAGLGVSAIEVNATLPLWIGLGVFLGSAAWWLILSYGSALFKEKMSTNARLMLNRISGVLILSFGVMTAISLLS